MIEPIFLFLNIFKVTLFLNAEQARFAMGDIKSGLSGGSKEKLIDRER